jgi:hypothetical protein
MRGIRVLPLAVLAMLSVTAIAGQPAPSLTANEIVSRMLAANRTRAENLKHYESVRVYELVYKGFPSDRRARMVVDLSYDQPGQKTFRIISEEGSRVLLDHVLHRAIESEQEAADQKNRAETDLNPNNYDFELLGPDTVDGRSAYVLRVKPKRGNKFLYDGRVWVDAAEFAVIRIDAKPARSPSLWISRATIQHRYQKHGEFWLPARNESRSHARFGGDALLTIDYSGYVINAAGPVPAAPAAKAPVADAPQTQLPAPEANHKLAPHPETDTLGTILGSMLTHAW